MGSWTVESKGFASSDRGHRRGCGSIMGPDAPGTPRGSSLGTVWWGQRPGEVELFPEPHPITDKVKASGLSDAPGAWGWWLQGGGTTEHVQGASVPHTLTPATKPGGSEAALSPSPDEQPWHPHEVVFSMVSRTHGHRG